MRRFGFLFAGLALAILALTPHKALSASAACSIANEAPIVVTGTSYSATVASACHTIIFTQTGGGVTASLPAPTTVPSGWWVRFKTQGTQTVSVTPTTGTLDGGTAAVAYTTGTSGMIISDHTAFYSIGLGIKSP
jgi:hypothetical protein